jgi:hypothetical protein
MGSFDAKSFAAAASHLPAGLSIALKRDLNITPSQYLADAAAAAQAVKVVASLKSAGVDILGSKIDGTRLTVNIASSADSSSVTAAGATAVIGAPAVPDFSKDDFHSVAAPNTYGGQGYFYQDSSQSGTIDGFRCSIGFSGYSVSALAPQFATAGHCAVDISGNATLITQTAPTNYGGTSTITSTSLGSKIVAHYGDNLDMDYGIVGEGSSVIPQASLYTWGGSTGAPLASAPLPIVGQMAAVVGANLCKSGSTSGWTCGTVLAVDTDVAVSGNPVNSIVATTCLLPGDSGGGAVIGQNAVGIDSGSDFPVTSCANPGAGTASGHESVFFPVVSAAGTKSLIGQQNANWKLLAAPVVTSPSAGATVAAGASITGTLFNATSGSSVSLFLDGSPSALATASASSGNWTIPLTGVSEGAHTYSLTETFAGNQVAAVTGSFIEAVTSVATVLSPSNGSKVYPNATMTGTITKPSANSTALLYLDGSTSPYATVSASTGSWTIPLTGIATGTHSYSLAAGVGSTPGIPVTGTFIETAFTATPVTFIDSATAGPGTISVLGWAYEPDPGMTGPIQVAVTLDGSAQSSVTANTVKTGFNAAFPGYGDNHGYSVSLSSISGGSHTVCISGVNAGTGPNSSPMCRAVTVPSGSPYGVVDSATGGPGSIIVSGWMVDPDTASAIQVGVTLDGVAQAPVTANAAKAGLGAALPGYGDNHGYLATVTPTTGGSHTVCVYGINVAAGVNGAPICRTVSIPTGNPFGVIDSAVNNGTAITVNGWMIDPDTVSAIQVQVFVDGVLKGTATANGVKSGLGAAFPGYGDNHGYSYSTSTAYTGTHQVCVVGINTGGGANGSQVCTSVPPPS